jgi:hypothetical protein
MERKSIANKAPAAFVNILEKKVLQNGGSFQRINTWKAKASQYNHLNHQYNNKKLSQRWNIYSAPAHPAGALFRLGTACLFFPLPLQLAVE